MKKQFSRVMMMVTFVACSLFSVSSYAQQDKHTPEEKAKRMTDSLKANLALTDSQYAKIYTVNVNYITKMEELRAQTGTKEEKMQSFKELRQSQKKDLSAVLTADQLEKFKTMQKEKREERREHHEEKADTKS